MTKKKWWMRFHVWLGISIGIFWALQGLTGALLVFNRDLQRAAYSQDSSGAALLPLDRIFEKASRAARAPVAKIEAFGAGPSLLLAYYERNGETRTLIVDGRTGAALDDRAPESMVPHGSGFWPWLLRFHEGLLGGETGQMVVGTSGLILLFSLAIGLWNAWPARRQRRAAFRIRAWRTTQQRLYGWHRMLGLAFMAPLTVTVACGLYLAFAPEIRPVLIARAGYEPAFSPSHAGKVPDRSIGIERAWREVQAEYPGAGLVRAVQPSPKSPFYVFRLLQRGEWRRWAGTSWAAVDPADGRIVARYDSLRGPVANRLTDNLYPVHTGEIGGTATRVLALLVGLQLPVLFVTGFMRWRRKRATRRRREPTFAPVSPIPAE
jgi:uncharacterized iron-regulated membrane protein